MKSKRSIITALIVLVIMIGFSGYSDMNNIYKKLYTLIGSSDLNKTTIEQVLGCELTSKNSPPDEFELFAPDPEIISSTFVCSSKIMHQEISEIVFEDFKSASHSEKTLTISLKQNQDLQMNQVTGVFGNTQELSTLALNVPDSQRCSFVYRLNGYEIIFGLKSCKGLEAINRVIIRKVFD